MVIRDVLKKFGENMRSRNMGAGVYNIEYPAYYYDGTNIDITVKLEMDSELVLERGEEVENLALLSTSDEYTIMDNGTVREKFSNIADIDTIIENACDRHHVKYDNKKLTLEADTETTTTKFNRFVKCIFEIESRVLDITGTIKESHTAGASEKLMAYLNKKGN